MIPSIHSIGAAISTNRISITTGDGLSSSSNNNIFSNNITSSDVPPPNASTYVLLTTTKAILENNSSRVLRPHSVAVPDWTIARVDLKWTWLLHTYGFACLFFMLAFYSFFSILNLRAQLSTRPYMSSVNVFLCLLGISRATCFLIDPYNSKGILPESIGSILWDLAFPCLISAFGLIQLAFIQLTQLKLGPSKLQSKSCMSLVVTTHFCLTIATNIIWSFQRDIKVLCYIYQTAFICWGIFLCSTFLYGGWKMMQMLRHAPPSLFQRSDSSGFENKVLALGLLANCHNLAAMTAAAAAAVPSFMAAPKIRITDENEQTYSYVSDNSHANSSQNLHAGETQDTSGTGGDSCRTSPQKTPGCSGGVYTVSEDGPATEDGDAQERAFMLQKETKESGKHVPKSNKKNDKTGLLAVMRSNGALKLNGRNGNNVNGNKRKNDVLEMSLLPCPDPALSLNGSKVVKQDLTLMSILNHIAYVNASEDCKFDARELKPCTRKNQIEKVLQGTYASAALGFVLCMLEAYRIYGQYGIAAGFPAPAPWPWFIFQTICRIAEFSMGCFMANITKQPVNRHQYPYSCHMKHRGGGLYF